MTKPPLTLMLTGDIILDDDEAEPLFDACRPVLAQADVAIGHVEVPHTSNPVQAVIGVPGHGGPPERLHAVGRAGFHVATLAANHFYDFGTEAVHETSEALRTSGVQTAGGGMNLAEARAPALIERNGTTVGVLSYNCVGPRESWASEGKAGAAYINCMTHHEGRDSYTFADPKTLRTMQDDVRQLRPNVDVLAIALHKGIVHTPAVIQDAEYQVSYAAIDAGADVVIGHHQHILRGIEIYKGKPIFHGLCNFVCVTHALSVNPNENDSPERLIWAERRRKMFGFLPDPDYPKYPFHPEAKNSMIGVVEIVDGAIKAGFIPLWIRPTGEPEPLGPGEKGDAVVDYVRKISAEAGLSTTYQWEGDRVIVS